MRSIALLSLLATSLSCSAHHSRIPETRPNDVTKIGRGTWFRHGALEEHGHSNNGFIEFEDFVVVVDANFPDGAEACIEDLARITTKPTRFVFDTHHHGDHAYGNPIWAKHGAVPMAHANVVVEMKRYEPGRWLNEARDDVTKLGLSTAMPPTITYVDKMVFDDGSQRVEFLHFGTAHTHGDGFAYLPSQRILFTGDAVVNGPHNYMGDGHSGTWLDVLDALLELDVEIVAPGHGACSDASLIQLQRDYIAFLRDSVHEGIENGESVEQMKTSVREKVPERLRRYVGRMFEDQIVKVHTDLSTPD